MPDRFQEFTADRSSTGKRFGPSWPKASIGAAAGIRRSITAGRPFPAGSWRGKQHLLTCVDRHLEARKGNYLVGNIAVFDQ